MTIYGYTYWTRPTFPTYHRAVNQLTKRMRSGPTHHNMMRMLYVFLLLCHIATPGKSTL